MTRPIKVVLENTDDKEAVLKNLRKLATATLELKRIRVTEDHTKAEREQIKQATILRRMIQAVIHIKASMIT